MKKQLFLAALFMCFAHTIYAQQTISDSLISGGIMRYYHVYVPKNYISGSPRPLIIYLHGYGSNATIDQAYTNFMPVADTAGFLVVYPEGTTDGSGYQYWNAGIPGLPDTPDDVAFISSLIDRMHVQYNINTNKVYATGLSNGGYMSYRLAWKLSDKIAAIASISGSMSPADFAQCTPPRPIPVMEIHGTADQTVPYTGSLIATDIDTLMRFWVINDHCFPISDPLAIPDNDPNDGSTVIHFEWVPEIQNESVELNRINGGGHVDWPGAFGSGNNEDFSASPVIWQFFNRFQTSASSVKEKGEQTSFAFYPNPCKSFVHISADVPGKVTITDITGRMLLSTEEKVIDLRSLISGCYQLRFEQNGRVRTEKLIKF